MGCVQSKTAVEKVAAGGGGLQSDDHNDRPFHCSAGNVNLGTNHGVINQNAFFRGYLNLGIVAPDLPQEHHIVQKWPSQTGNYCYVPARLSTAPAYSQAEGIVHEVDSGSTPPSGMHFKQMHSNGSRDSPDRKSIAGHEPPLLLQVSAGNGGLDLLALDNARSDRRPTGDSTTDRDSRSNESQETLPSFSAYAQRGPSVNEVFEAGAPLSNEGFVEVADGASPPPGVQQFMGHSMGPPEAPPGSPDFEPSPPPMSAPPQPTSLPGSAQKADEARMVISIDFGTTMSGVVYGCSRIAAGKVQQILTWPGSFGHVRKIPTCLLYDKTGKVRLWGLEAHYAYSRAGENKCEWFKLFLEPHLLRDESRLPDIPLGKEPIDLVIDFLTCLWEYARDQIARDIGAVSHLHTAEVWLPVPAAWDAKSCEIMREAAIAAGLVQSSHTGDTNWRDRLKIITQPEAAAAHCVPLIDLHHLKPSQTFIVCDAGGGTVDLAVYKIIGNMAHLEIAEIGARSGSNCGSLFLDLWFKELAKNLLVDHPAHLDGVSQANFMQSFSEADRLNYAGTEDDGNMFHFTCFNVEDPHDPTVGLFNGQLSIPGNLLRREVFDPVVDQVIQLLEEQITRANQPIHALLLVGGFAGSEYLRQRVESQFKNRIPIIARPPDADTATLHGAAQYGLAKRSLISTIICPRSYIMKVELPAEHEDWLKRPAYIKLNEAGVPVCGNRLQYLVSKGAIIHKGQRLTTKFCKFSQTPSDFSFAVTLFISDNDKTMRYTDEGEMLELCKLTVDLTSLPTFQQNAATSNMAGFYTEFELGLEFDSLEIRGDLLYNGQEWTRVVFDFLR